jgi:Holliday junction resolvase RusA-like endonuclease
MTDVPGFVIHGPPRTKKNSGRIVVIPTKGSRRCHACGHMSGFPKILPSEAYEAWEVGAIRELMEIKPRLGVELPITAPVSIEALIYRKRDTGDIVGYLQAIGDMLQAAGVLKDDRQIEDWDGSRRLKDAANPRCEIFIRVLDDGPRQEELCL